MITEGTSCKTRVDILDNVLAMVEYPLLKGLDELHGHESGVWGKRGRTWGMRGREFDWD